MKLFSRLLLLLVVITAVLSSCSDNVTYAEQLKAEKELIADYIKRNNIKVVSEFPTKFPWDENVYVLTKSGMYFHLVSQGDMTEGADTLAKNDLVVPRFYQITLNTDPVTISNWNTVDYPYPTTFNYNDLTQACAGWHEAVSYMKRNNSRALFILHPKIGFTATDNSVVPYLYDMKIKMQK